MFSRPSEEIPLDSLVLRRWRPGDAAALHDAVTKSVEHLRPWMPWISEEPVDLAARREKLDEFIGKWDLDEEFGFGIFDGEDVVGACGLNRTIAADGLEIGYWVHVDRTREGIATSAVRGLVGAAFAMSGISHVEIHHDLANVASGRVAEHAGFVMVEERREEVSAPGEVGVERIWRLTRPS